MDPNKVLLELAYVRNRLDKVVVWGTMDVQASEEYGVHAFQKRLQVDEVQWGKLLVAIVIGNRRMQHGKRIGNIMLRY